MDAEFIIKSIVGLALILAILIFLLFLDPKKHKHASSKSAKKTHAHTEKKETVSSEKPKLETLVNIIKNKKTDTQKLSESLSLIIEYYGTINKKLATRAHPDFAIYGDILFNICRHPNTNKDIILTFDKELQKLNPEYKKEINEAITKGLYSRGA